jgi:hypothetical protein
MAPLKTLTSFALIALMATSGLTGCAETTNIGKITSIDGGTQIIVPALWANTKNNTGGIEPASIWVDTSRTSDQLAYEINLSNIDAKGGGAMWRAATSSAAAIGTLFSGFNPDDIAYSFDITGPIDGPSAGAILTVGVLAALNKHPLDPQTTMTGTISPDGAIGPVALIPQKLKAAAAAGYKRVLIPSILTSISDPDSGKMIDTKEFGKRLGVEVFYVATLDAAYQAFTGSELFSAPLLSSFPFAQFTALDMARADAAHSLQDAVSELLAAKPDAPLGAQQQLAASEKASSQGDHELAFGLAVDALGQFGAWDGSASFVLSASAQGASYATTELTKNIQQNKVGIDEQLAKTVALSQSMPSNQNLALPGALGWLTYSRSVLDSIITDMNDNANPPEDRTVLEYAGLARQVSLDAEIVFPRIMDVLRATPAFEQSHNEPVDAFLSGYTNFLVAAGDANLAYLRAVEGLSEKIEERSTVSELVPVAIELGEEAATINPETESLEVELEESSVAMTYFVATTSLVFSLEVFGSTDLWLNPEASNVTANAYIENSITQSSELTEEIAHRLLAENFNAGYVVWSAKWGKATYAELVEQKRTSTGITLAINELWYDVITSLSMNAFLKTT